MAFEEKEDISLVNKSVFKESERLSLMEFVKFDDLCGWNRLERTSIFDGAARRFPIYCNAI